MLVFFLIHQALQYLGIAQAPAIRLSTSFTTYGTEMGKSKAFKYNTTTSSSTAKAASPKVKGNPFDILEVEELSESFFANQTMHSIGKPQPTGLLKLPLELRDAIYDYLSSDRANLVVRRLLKNHDACSARHSRLPYALLFVNKQIAQDFRSALYRHVPHHLSCTIDELPEIGPLVHSFGMGKESINFPSQARYWSVDLFIPEGGTFGSSEEFQLHAVASKGFSGIASILLDCQQAKEILLKVRFGIKSPIHVTNEDCHRNNDDDDYDHSNPEDEDEDQSQDEDEDEDRGYAQDSKCTILYDSIIQIIESLPNILQYSVEVVILRDGVVLSEGAAYAKREKEDTWESTQVLKLTNEILEQPEGGWWDLYLYFGQSWCCFGRS